MSTSGTSLKRVLAFFSIAAGMAHSTLGFAGIVLTNGVPRTGLAGAAGSAQEFEISVPDGATNLRFVTSGGPGDADIYVKHSVAPSSPEDVDAKSENSTNSESISIAAPKTGTYHLVLVGYTAYSGLTLTASFTAPSGGTQLSTTQVLRLSTPSLTAQAGGTINLGMRFNAVPMAEDYQVFVHFVSSADAIALGADHAPSTPTSRWSGTVSYSRSVTLPSTMANGTYSIRVGLYQNHSPYDRVTLLMGSGVTTDGAVRYEVGTLTVGATAPTQSPVAPPSSSVTLTGFQATNDATNVIYQYNFTGTISFHRVLLDTDNDPATGYASDGIGGNFLIENGTLYQHSGSATDWTWNAIKQVSVSSTASSMRLTVARADLGSPTTIKVIAQVASAAGEALSGIFTQTLISTPPSTVPTPSITLSVQGAPNLPLNGTTALVTVGLVDGTPTKVELSRDGFAPFASWPSGTFFTLTADGKSLTGNWCISSSCWGGVAGIHVLNAVATYSNGSTKSASVSLNVTDTSSTPPPAQAFYVSPSGNDANPGSQSAPWRTIQKAASTLSAGQTAILMDGVYEEGEIRFLRNGTPSSRITFKAQNKWKAIVSSYSGCGSAFRVEGAYITIEDIRFSVSPRNVPCPVYDSSNGALRAWPPGEGIHIRGVYVEKSSQRALALKSNQDYALIENSEVHDLIDYLGIKDSVVRNNVMYEGDQWGNIIIAKGGSRSIEIYNNILHMTKPGSVALILGGYSCDDCFFDPSTKIEAYNSVAYNNVVINESGGYAVGLAFWGAKDSAFLNNVVIGAQISIQPGGYNTGFRALTQNATFRNNIITCNGMPATNGWSGNYSGTLTVDSNNFSNCTGLPAQTNAVSGDPLFVNPASDWHLRSGSPALNRGAALTGFRGYDGQTIDVSKDFNGVVRTAPWDLGIFNQ